jgi:antirestriction protein ArdC
MAAQIRRDLYAEVTSRILAELERGAAPWVKPWSATPGQNVPQMTRTMTGHSSPISALALDLESAPEDATARIDTDQFLDASTWY